MKKEIYEEYQHYFTVPFITALANNIDEPNPGISKAVSAIIPTALAALKIKAKDHAQLVYSMATDASRYYSKAPDVATLQNTEKGSDLPYRFFGENEQAVNRHIAAYSGLRPGSVSSLVLLVLPVVLGKIGDRLKEDDLLDNEVEGLLPGQGEELNRLCPPGYTIPDLSHSVSVSKEEEKQIHEDSVKRNKSNFVFPKWIPIAAVVVVILMLIYFSRM